MTKHLKKRNIIFLVIIILLLIPKSRQAIQIVLHKGIALVNPISEVSKNERIKLENFDWVLLKENGVPYNFNEAKGKVILINFWATWCPPCIAEMSSLQKLYDKFGNKIEFLFVTNEPSEIVQNFKAKKMYDFPVYIRQSDIPKEFITRSIPRTIIINKSGEIVIDKSGAVNWNSDKVISQLNQLLKE
ncbi:MAG: TlpA family protein disulfide reductase [Winogradskyella sp.]|uniref:TlpA family protein disulfide reductase n=1 Tax=Winogradskyella sp. TaxID=1883156 RepID=UPI0017B7C19C|nr:TlpA family protein disulfide reductase [Winogradskyella sp.]